MRHKIPANVKQATRDKYAWPGGYPFFLLMHDSEALCITCARDNWHEVARATVQADRSGWHALDAAINYEDHDLQCAHCNQPIEAAYPKE